MRTMEQWLAAGAGPSQRTVTFELSGQGLTCILECGREKFAWRVSSDTACAAAFDLAYTARFESLQKEASAAAEKWR